jgi:hypothetical protein
MKFSGKVGYGADTETAPGVHEEVITERSYYGDIVQNRRALRVGEDVNPAVSLGNSISIVADAFARENFIAIRYVIWQGVYWTVTDVEIQHPRLILRMGEVYNGLTAPAPDSP